MADTNPGNKTLALIRRNAWMLVAAVAALLAVSGIIQRLHTGPAVTIGGPFTLTDQNGQRVSDTDFRGKLEIVYFGFTHCPDACPTSLALIAQAVKKLPSDKARQVQPIFITLDPERDTPQAMGEYVNYFLPGMEGLTGSAEEIADVARAYRVAYQKAKDPNSDQPYTIDHASMIFVMDKKGKFLRYFPPGVTADQLAEVLNRAL